MDWSLEMGHIRQRKGSMKFVYNLFLISFVLPSPVGVPWLYYASKQLNLFSNQYLSGIPNIHIEIGSNPVNLWSGGLLKIQYLFFCRVQMHPWILFWQYIPMMGISLACKTSPRSYNSAWIAHTKNLTCGHRLAMTMIQHVALIYILSVKWPIHKHCFMNFVSFWRGKEVVSDHLF